MDRTTVETATSISVKKKETRGHSRHIVFVQVIRLAWLALTIVAILLLTILIRHLTASAGFVVEQQINMIAVIVGLVLVAIVYSLGIVRMLRTIREWEHEGKTTLATGALWMLGITAVILALPVVLVFFLH